MYISPDQSRWSAPLYNNRLSGYIDLNYTHHHHHHQKPLREKSRKQNKYMYNNAHNISNWITTDGSELNPNSDSSSESLIETLEVFVAHGPCSICDDGTEDQSLSLFPQKVSSGHSADYKHFTQFNF